MIQRLSLLRSYSLSIDEEVFNDLDGVLFRLMKENATSFRGICSLRW